MDGQRTRNGLLFIIALCLVLIVLRLYSVNGVREASAAGWAPPPDARAYLFACSSTSAGDCTKVATANWVAVRASADGHLLTN